MQVAAWSRVQPFVNIFAQLSTHAEEVAGQFVRLDDRHEVLKGKIGIAHVALHHFFPESRRLGRPANVEEHRGERRSRMICMVFTAAGQQGKGLVPIAPMYRDARQSTETVWSFGCFLDESPENAFRLIELTQSQKRVGPAGLPLGP
jgi:hypothetical protein